MLYCIEELTYIQIQHPIHFLFTNSVGERIERIVLTASRLKPVRKTFEAGFIDFTEECNYRLLHKLILSALNTERSLFTISLWAVEYEYVVGRFAV